MCIAVMCNRTVFLVVASVIFKNGFYIHSKDWALLKIGNKWNPFFNEFILLYYRMALNSKYLYKKKKKKKKNPTGVTIIFQYTIS